MSFSRRSKIAVSGFFQVPINEGKIFICLFLFFFVRKSPKNCLKVVFPGLIRDFFQFVSICWKTGKLFFPLAY